jgi:hypothetical protein
MGLSYHPQRRLGKRGPGSSRGCPGRPGRPVVLVPGVPLARVDDDLSLGVRRAGDTNHFIVPTRS